MPAGGRAIAGVLDGSGEIVGVLDGPGALAVSGAPDSGMPSSRPATIAQNVAAVRKDRQNRCESGPPRHGRKRR